MAKREENFNVFDLAGSQKKKTRPKNPVPPLNTPNKPAPLQPQPLKFPEESSESKPEQQQPAEKLSLEEVTEMFEKMNQLHQDLQTKLETAYQKAGLSRHDIKKLLKIIGEEDKKQLQKSKQELEEKIWGVLGEDAREQKLHKDRERLARIRKSKTGGGRRKWIQTK